jgi:hypothetical protein
MMGFSSPVTGVVSLLRMHAIEASELLQIAGGGESTRMAPDLPQMCSLPHDGHCTREAVSGRRSNVAESVSMPVAIGRPVCGHVIITMAIDNSPKPPLLSNFLFIYKRLSVRSRTVIKCNAAPGGEMPEAAP